MLDLAVKNINIVITTIFNMLKSKVETLKIFKRLKIKLMEMKTSLTEKKNTLNELESNKQFQKTKLVNLIQQ